MLWRNLAKIISTTYPAFTLPSWANVIDIQPTATGPVLTEPSNYENYKNDSGASWRGSTFYKLIRLAAVSTLHWQLELET